jgi:hypothetical protein
MATEKPNPIEAQNVIPELQLNLRDVPNDKPDTFNDGMAKNIEASRDGLIAYLNANRKKAIEQNPLAEFKIDGHDELLSAQIDVFIANIKLHANIMLKILKDNRDKPVDEQKELLAISGSNFQLRLAEQQGVMQSFIPFKLKAGYELIDQKIMAPLHLSYVSGKGREQEVRQPTPMEMVRAAVQKLEKSDISGDIKELMDGWLLENIKEPSARNAYIEKVREHGKDIKIGDMLEGMADIYLGAHPELNAKLQTNRTEELPKVFEGMFDVLFQYALSVNEGKGREDAHRKVEHTLARFKEIVS